MKKLNLLVSLVLITGVCAFALMHQGGLRLSLSPELTMQKVVVELKSEQPPTEKKAPLKKSA